MDHVEGAHRGTGLVRLQAADDVPLRVGDRGELGKRLLHPVLAEAAQSGGERLEDDSRSEALGDRHHTDGVRVPARGLGGDAQPFE